MKGQKDVQRIEALRMRKLLRRKDLDIGSGIAIDGGAHVGSWTVEMAKHFKVIHAFEPCWESYAMLCENIINSDLEAEVIPHNKALLDSNCLVRIVAPSGRTTLTARQVKVTSRGNVEAVTIDSLELESCDFIKLDLEGAEGKAIAGARRTIKKFKPFMVIEFNNLVRNFGGSESAIHKQLEKLGYIECWRDGVDRGYKWQGT